LQEIPKPRKCQTLKGKEQMATIEGLSYLHQKVKPTKRKVLSMIQADPQNNTERLPGLPLNLQRLD